MNAKMMTRLSEKERALLAGNDAGFWLRMKARFATPTTDESRFSTIRAEMPRFRELPEYFAWDDLAAEMKANILVGVEAGEAIRSRPDSVPLGWKAGLVFAGIALLMVSGYWWQLPGRFGAASAGQQAILEARPGGLELQNRETAFTVIYGRESGQQALSGGIGSIRADYVDEETGQLTVAHVYAE
ncbi:MAG: hypothetical protein U5J83_05855 [Bryobacterales bacterium]|nr:hypothetical protein [Bryobacterales bacterium]